MGRRPRGSRAGSGTMSKGKAREREILAAARGIFLEKGYESLTLRNVALRVGISMGNLQYYFRTKEDVEREVLREAGDLEIRECIEQFEGFSGAAEQRFKALVAFLLARIGTVDTRGLHLQGWALAMHANHAEDRMEWLYRSRCAVIARAIEAVNPAIDCAESATRATVVHAMIAGSLFSLVAQEGRLVKRGGLDRIIERHALALAKAAPSSRTAP